MRKLKDKAAIVGIGATEISKNSGRSEMRMAVEAISEAVADAGLSLRDVDGLCAVSMDNNDESEIFRNIGGRELKFWSRTNFSGGGTLGPVLHAAMAVDAGIADVVVCYRSLNQRSEYRFGQALEFKTPSALNALFSYHAYHGAQTAAAMMAFIIQRYMHEYGATSADFANIALAARKHASTNPKAVFYGKPLTFDDYMASRLVTDPLRLFDICLENDAAVACVVTSAERAKSLRQKPALIRAGAQAASHGLLGGIINYYGDNIAQFDEMKLLGKQLYAAADLTPADIDVGIIYDHFGPSVMLSLEALGFCKQGEAKDFIKNGNIEVGGSLPVNTHGGQVGEGYVHGMNGITEAVRQVRGTAANQVKNVRNVLVTSGSGLPTSGAILSAA